MKIRLSDLRQHKTTRHNINANKDLVLEIQVPQKHTRKLERALLGSSCPENLCSRHRLSQSGFYMLNIYIYILFRFVCLQRDVEDHQKDILIRGSPPKQVAISLLESYSRWPPIGEPVMVWDPTDSSCTR